VGCPIFADNRHCDRRGILRMKNEPNPQVSFESGDGECG
jgi:hypothetical protein